MDDKLKGELTRAVQHSSDFLFGLPVYYNDYSKGRQEKIYEWLREEGKKNWGENVDFKNGTYDGVTSQLLKTPGIEKLVVDIIIPRVHALFSDDIIKELRDHWLNGLRPDNVFLKRYRLNKESAFPFLIVTEFKTNSSFQNIDGWGELFASTWFEYIEPWIKEKESKNED